MTRAEMHERSIQRGAIVLEASRAGLSRKACAERAGCNVSYVSYIRQEAGFAADRSPPRAPSKAVQVTLTAEERSHLARIASYLGKSRSEAIRALIAKEHAALEAPAAAGARS